MSQLSAKINSTRITEIWYDEKNLTVLFPNGAKYVYYSVPKETVVGLIKAPSSGAYFQKHIIDKKYRYERIDKTERSEA